MNDRFSVVPWGFNWNSIVATPGFSAEADNLYKKLEKERQVNMTGCIGSGKTTLAFLMCKEHNISKVFRVAAHADDLKQCIIDNWHACTVSHEQLEKTRYDIDAIPKPSYETVLCQMNEKFSAPGSLIILDLNDAETINVVLPEKANVLVISRSPVGNLPTFSKREEEDGELLARVFADHSSDRRSVDEWDYAFGCAVPLLEIFAYNLLLMEQVGIIARDLSPDALFKSGTDEVDTSFIVKQLTKEKRIGITQWDRNPAEDKTCSTALKTLGII